MALNCGDVFHGDCICWELRSKSECPNCHSNDVSLAKIYCLKCLTNYVECNPEVYVQFKKRRCRVCDDCCRTQNKFD